MEGLNKASPKRQGADYEEICNQWPFSAESVRKETKDNLFVAGCKGSKCM